MVSVSVHSSFRDCRDSTDITGRAGVGDSAPLNEFLLTRFMAVVCLEAFLGDLHLGVACFHVAPSRASAVSPILVHLLLEFLLLM